MMHDKTKRLSLFILIVGLSAVVPIMGSQSCQSPSEWCDILASVGKFAFPVQLFPIVEFFFDLVGLRSFWVSYIVYLIIVSAILLKIGTLYTRLSLGKNVMFFFVVCGIFYFVNAAIFRYHASSFVQSLPEQPFIP
jgi:hypothetical protein